MDEVLSKLQSVFGDPIIFMLKRKDMVAQAVSHYFMAETGVGHSYQSNIGHPETYYEIRYDVKKLLKWYLFTRDSYALWDEIFQKNNISPIHIYYEDMMEDLYQTILSMTSLINNAVEPSRDQIEAISVKTVHKIPVSQKKEFIKDLEALFYEKNRFV